MLALFTGNARELGRPFADRAPAGQMNRASTDMANVSLIDLALREQTRHRLISAGQR
jgi:hypothetical protein